MSGPNAVPAILRRLILLWAAALTPLLFWLSSNDMFEQPKQLALKTAAAAVALLAALYGRNAGVLASPLQALLAFALVSVPFSPLPFTAAFGEYMSYQGWFHWLALAILLCVLAGQVADRRELRRFMAASIISASLVSAYALIQLAGADPVPWSVGGPVLRAFSTAGNPLYLGFFLAASFPLCVGIALAVRSPGKRWLFLAAGLLVLLGLLSSGSRSALAGGLAGAAVILWLRHGVPAELRAALRNFALAAAALLILGAILLPADRNPVHLLGRRMLEFSRGEDARPRIWAAAFRLIRERPLTGHGLDTFATLQPRVQSARLWDFVWHGSPEKAHNEFLQIAATAGIPAAGAALWLAVLLGGLAWRRRGDPLAASCAGGLAALLVPGLFGFTTSGTHAIALVLAAGVAARPTPGRAVPKALSWAIAVILLVSAAIHFHFAASEVALKSAVRNGSIGIEKALALRTPWAQRLLGAGDVLERAWFGPNIGKADEVAIQRLVLLSRLYEEALAVNPLHPFAHSDLGRVLLREGRTSEGWAEYEKARALAPRDAYLVLEESQVLLAAGKEEDAVALVEEAAKLYPDFAEPPGLIGYLWLKKKKPEKAEPWLRKAVEGNWHGNTGAAYAAAVNLVVLYRDLKRYEDAAWAESQAMKYAPPQSPQNPR